jgi:tetratricopeptide (TPR) repeat protein
VELMGAVPDPDTRHAFAAVRNLQGFLMIDASPDGPRDAAFKAFQEALYYLLPLYNDMPRVIHFQRSVASTLIGRGICHRGLKKFGEARADFSTAAQLLDRLDVAIPGHFYHLGLRGLIHANLSRTSRAEGKPDGGDLPKAVHCHLLALEANPASPEDRKLLAECRQELIRLEAGATPRPDHP